MEDGLLVFHDWSEVVSELHGSSEQQCKGRYRLDETVVELTFVFLCVTFRGSPFLRSALVITKDVDSVDSARSTTTYVFPPSPVSCPFPPSFLTQVHKCIGYPNQKITESAQVRETDVSKCV